MLIELGPATIEEFVSRPGIALLDWRDPSDAQSLIADRFIETTAEAHPDVRFGMVDRSRYRKLADDWDVRQIPTVMAYRDGMLLFSRSGPLPPPALDALVQALWSLDIDELRKTVDGHSPRLSLIFQPADPDRFEVELGHWPTGGSSPGQAPKGGRPS